MRLGTWSQLPRASPTTASSSCAPARWRSSQRTCSCQVGLGRTWRRRGRDAGAAGGPLHGRPAAQPVMVWLVRVHWHAAALAPCLPRPQLQCGSARQAAPLAPCPPTCPPTCPPWGVALTPCPLCPSPHAPRAPRPAQPARPIPCPRSHRPVPPGQRLPGARPAAAGPAVQRGGRGRQRRGRRGAEGQHGGQRAWHHHHRVHDGGRGEGGGAWGQGCCVGGGRCGGGAMRCRRGG